MYENLLGLKGQDPGRPWESNKLDRVNPSLGPSRVYIYLQASLSGIEPVDFPVSMDQFIYTICAVFRFFI